MDTFDSRQAAIDGILRIFADSIDHDDIDTILKAEGSDLLPLRRQFSKEINKLKASRLILGRLMQENESILRNLKYRDGDWIHSVHHKYNFYLEKLLECDKLALQIYDTLPKDKVNGPTNVSQSVQPPQKRVRRTKAEIAAARSTVQSPAGADKSPSAIRAGELASNCGDGETSSSGISAKKQRKRRSKGAEVSE